MANFTTTIALGILKMTAFGVVPPWPSAFCISEASLSAASMARDRSSARFNVNLGSANNRRCILISRTPHPSRSRGISSNVIPYSQCSDRCLNSAKNIGMVSPSCWERVINLNRWTIADGLGMKWSWRSFAKSSWLLGQPNFAPVYRFSLPHKPEKWISSCQDLWFHSLRRNGLHARCNGANLQFRCTRPTSQTRAWFT